ncbi:hypothetical protein MNBD_GAMMA13-1553 [hydrothermal vent metagenome]|uniref:Regulatory protein, RpfE type n=1 Tax=hydrothermal vent metagenome TaxID=652676 RepID=A0A3B0Y799_9ZZZZ
MSKWLSRAQINHCTDSYTEQAALRLLNVDDTATPPVAACSYYHDFGEWPNSYCLRADPVHLHVDLHGLIVFDGSTLAVTPEESQGLTQVLADHLLQDSWILRQGGSCRWYLLGEDQDLTGPALCQVRGRHTSLNMLKGEHASPWTRRLNELQMLMASQASNTQRQAERRQTINSLWLWGGGSMPGSKSDSQPACFNLEKSVGSRKSTQAFGAPGKPEKLLITNKVTTNFSDSPCTPISYMSFSRPTDLSRFNSLVSKNPATLGAADINHVEPIAADSAEQLLDRITTKTSTSLVVLESCRDAAAYGDCESWNQSLQQLETQWFEPLLSALSAKRLDAIELFPLNGFTYQLTRRGLWKFWQPSRDYRSLSGFRQITAGRV